MDLFEAAADRDLSGAPLAERMRPRSLDEVAGQQHLVGEGAFLPKQIARGRLPSLIFWGPPGTGKTTLAEVLGRSLDLRFERISAVLAGVKDLRAAVEQARRARAEQRRGTLLFVDEIHRFNKAQQDALLPHVEKGVVTLVGATTENPSFEVNAALLSRCRVLVLRALDDESLAALIERALTNTERGLGELGLSLDDDAREALVRAAGGDARRTLSSLEIAADLARAEGIEAIGLRHAEEAVARRVVLFDKAGDSHFDVASALIKSLRGSDPDAALHYLARMIEGGEDVRFILRRLIIFASEDIGNADPRALQLAVAAQQAFDMVGMPEGVYALSQITAYLAMAPKSNTALRAIRAAREDVLRHPAAAIPPQILNAPTSLMKSLGRGRDYQYPHDYPDHYVAETYLPDALVGARYFEPSESGFEARLKGRLEELRARRQAARDDEDA